MYTVHGTLDNTLPVVSNMTTIKNAKTSPCVLKSLGRIVGVWGYIALDTRLRDSLIQNLT